MAKYIFKRNIEYFGTTELLALGFGIFIETLLGLKLAKLGNLLFSLYKNPNIYLNI
jgi:hypothetical protein